MSDNKFYGFTATNIQGKEESMSDYEGKVVVVVNTASKCGLAPQYEGLEELYRSYSDKGLVVLGFPCNQFGWQEPGDESQIQEFCQLNYGVSFPMFAKIDVNGSKAHPIFAYLKSKLGGTFGDAIKWNFTKFVIDRNGKPIQRFAPTDEPKEMKDLIEELLAD